MFFTPSRTRHFLSAILSAGITFYAASSTAALIPVPAIELPPPNVRPVAAVELAPPALMPVEARELASITPIELPLPGEPIIERAEERAPAPAVADTSPTLREQQAVSEPVEHVRADAVVQARNTETPAEHESFPVHEAPKVHNTNAPSDYNPAVY